MVTPSGLLKQLESKQRVISPCAPLPRPSHNYFYHIHLDKHNLTSPHFCNLEQGRLQYPKWRPKGLSGGTHWFDRGDRNSCIEGHAALSASTNWSQTRDRKLSARDQFIIGEDWKLFSWDIIMSCERSCAVKLCVAVLGVADIVRTHNSHFEFPTSMSWKNMVM